MRQILRPLESLRLSYLRWHYPFAVLFVAAVVMSIIAAFFGSTQGLFGSMEASLWALAGLLLIASFAVACFGVLLSCHKIISLNKNCNEQLENIAEITNRNNNTLTQIAKTISFSDAARAVIFRDQEIAQLRDTVLGVLHQHDFESTNAMIDFLSTHRRYASLAAQLRQLADQYRNATEDEQVNQTITHIYELCRQYNWNQASSEVERLRRAFPKSAKAEAIGDKVRELKDARKMELLTEWDQAVKNNDPDKNLEVLKELDPYLTPNEGLALQESAAEVFKTKLHNLGLEFTLAVSTKQWHQAIRTGEQIIEDFPNSRMAHEIQGKIQILSEKAKLM